MSKQNENTSPKTIAELDAEYSAQQGKLTFNASTWLDAMQAVTRNNKDRWDNFCGQSYQDPHTLAIKSIFDVMSHMFFKQANSNFDVNVMAYADKGFRLAMDEIERQRWQIGTKEQSRPMPQEKATPKKGLAHVFDHIDDPDIKAEIVRMFKKQKRSQRLQAMVKAGIDINEIPV